MAKIKQEDIQDSLEKSLKSLEAKYGKGSIIHGSDMKENIEVVSSGSLMLDIASSVGGIPVGKLIELYGMESSGKSTLTLHIIAEFQKAGKKCVLCDAEQAFDRKYATNLGVNIDELIILQPECMEYAYNQIEELIRTGRIGLVVVDSHTSLMPKKVVDGEVGEVTIGLQARINSTALGKIKPLLRDNNCTMMSISQIRQNVGGYGDPNIATGGLSYKFYSDMRFKVSKSVDKEADQNKTVIEIVKNKCGVPYNKALFNIQWGTGIDKMQEIVDSAVELGLITRKGAGWMELEIEGQEIPLKLQGDEKVKQFMRDNEEYYNLMREKVLKHFTK